MKKVLNFIWGLLKNNLPLKIMAVLFAIVLWSYVLAQTNPVRERTFDNIQVNYTGTAELQANGLAVSNTLSDAVLTVGIRVEVDQNNAKYVTKDNVTATVDLAKVSSTGELTFEIKASSPYGTAEVIGSKTVKLYIDKYTSRPLPVTPQFTGRAETGYYASEPVFEPDVVTISGARSDIAKAVRAVCPIDLSGLTEWKKKSMSVTVLDDEDNALDPNLFSQSLPSVIVGMDILPVKTVPVDVQSSIFGQDSLAPGFEVKSIECDPATVRIAGTEEALAGVTSIPLVPYSVSDASGDVSVMLYYQPPEGVTVLGTTQAQVTVTIREKTATEDFTGVGIDVRNLGKGLNVQLSQTEVDVTVLAGVSAMSTLTAADVVPYIDLNGYGEGTYTVDILFELPEGFASENFTPRPLTITVTITRG